MKNLDQERAARVLWSLLLLRSLFTEVMCLLQAARDGLLDVVEGHLALEASRMNDTDEDGLTAMHHAARYNRVNVLNRLVEAGGGELHNSILVFPKLKLSRI